MRFCEASEGCKYPVFSTDKITKKGYCKSHATRYRTDLDRRTIIQRAMGKQSKLESSVRSLQTPEVKEATQKQIWFTERRKEMTGWCQCGCSETSSKNEDKFFRHSICHILPQEHFKSVQFHLLNWIEMNFWLGHHTNFDNRGSDRWPQLACWEEIAIRFKIMYPLLWFQEIQFIPKVLQQFIPQDNVPRETLLGNT